jgi:hypothetical protein
MALVRSRVNEKRQQIQYTDATYSESYGSSSSQFVSASNAQTVKKSPRFASLASLGSGDSSGEDNNDTFANSFSGSPAHPHRNRFISPSIASSTKSTTPSESSAIDAANISSTTASDQTASSGTRLTSSGVEMRQDEFAGLVATLEAELQARDIVIALLKVLNSSASTLS